jgi:protein-tyrosine phosphatase
MPTGFDAVLGLRWELEDYAAPFSTDGPKVFSWIRMVDGPQLPESNTLFCSVDMVLNWWQTRKLKTLVHCAEGHNRSGLVIGLVLRSMMYGFGGQEALDLIRSKRPGALSNSVFAQKVLSYPA